jgi:excisionase family DNA binding protein
VDELCYTPAEMCRILKISRNKGYELLRTNAIRHIRIGSIIRIPHSAIQEFLGEGIDSAARQESA